MSSFVEDKDRKVIPGWRDSLTTATKGELDSLGSLNQTPLSDRDFFAEKLNAWKTSKGLSQAAELVASAIVLKREDEAIEAAKAILQAKSKSSPAVIGLAELVTNPTKQPSNIVDFLMRAGDNFPYDC